MQAWSTMINGNGTVTSTGNGNGAWLVIQRLNEAMQQSTKRWSGLQRNKERLWRHHLKLKHTCTPRITQREATINQTMERQGASWSDSNGRQPNDQPNKDTERQQSYQTHGASNPWIIRHGAAWSTAMAHGRQF
jgi:hypothetical protein